MTHDVPEFVQRMAEEFQQLDERTDKLDRFICTNPVFADLTAADQHDCRQQLVHMLLYREALQRRLLRFGARYATPQGDKQ